MSGPNPAVSPFQTVTSKKSGKISTRTIVVTISIVIFLLLGVVAGVLLVRQQQDIRERAQGYSCPAAEECPVSGQKDLLRNCTPNYEEGTPPQEIWCSNPDNAKQIAQCGGVSFCCPSVTSNWTTDLTECATPIPTPSFTPTATPLATETPAASASATPTSTATATATPTATAYSTSTATPYSTSSATPRPLATPREIPVSGIDWPSILGIGIGVVAIIGAILLAI